MRMNRERTRKSLVYVAGYLLFGGAGLLAAPETMLRLFHSTGAYSDIMVRFVGVLLLSLGIFVAQVIRQRAEGLYATTLIIRVLILAVLVVLYALSLDPLMLVLFGIVGVGVAVTAMSMVRDWSMAGR